jgi:S-adenosylmethionine decarboxylase
MKKCSVFEEALSLFFEGAEKKAEIQIHNDKLSLLHDIDNDFWHRLVDECAAKILSVVENNVCKAFLLSESSLFVWDDRFLIITCGETRLINSVDFFIENYGKDLIKQLTYQRKNEYFSHAQPSCFGDDVKLLSKHLDGQAYRFGPLDGHHNFIFHYENQFVVNLSDKTYELLAYQISSQASKILSTPNLPAQQIRQFFKLDKLIPDFQIDDFVFDPFGYSLNAIHKERYLTIHVTPQETSSYVSFEANFDLVTLVPEILNVLEPKSIDLLTYNEFDFENKAQDAIPPQYIAATKIATTLSNGYQVQFCNYLIPANDFAEPIKVSLLGDDHVL